MRKFLAGSIALALLAIPLVGTAQTNQKTVSPAEYVRPYLRNPLVADTSKAPIQGNPRAEVTIVEFSDFQCPYCQKSQATLQQLKRKYGERLRTVFLHYPLPMHKEAKGAARAAWAAQQQGKFWPYHDALFIGQDKLGEQLYVQTARDLKLDLDRFNSDRQSLSSLRAVEADKAQGEQLGIESTPSFLINGILLPGNYPVEAFDQIIAAWKEGKGKVSSGPR
ncbi:MAG: thioredoxin domain-containing protein [Gemmatimonadaceae bacterium]|nr:thioredoxin domain-containing protein [Gloeobacterales cyanobacterium ES-bin-141]